MASNVTTQAKQCGQAVLMGFPAKRNDTQHEEMQHYDSLHSKKKNTTLKIA